MGPKFVSPYCPIIHPIAKWTPGVQQQDAVMGIKQYRDQDWSQFWTKNGTETETWSRNSKSLLLAQKVSLYALGSASDVINTCSKNLPSHPLYCPTSYS